jgi:hypothetical protein
MGSVRVGHSAAGDLGGKIVAIVQNEITVDCTAD